MTEPKNNDRPEENENEKTARQLRGKAFQIALEMIAVFGIPAVLALVVGGWLETGGYGSWPRYALLGVAFVLSWIIVFVRVKRFARNIDEQNDQADENQE